MTSFPHPERFALSGFVCSALVVLAGLMALVGAWSPALPSVLLTVAAILFAVGFGTARTRPRRFDIGLLLPIAAALPLFGLFYAMGVFILERFGQALGGWLLIGLGVALAAACGVWVSRTPRAARQ